MGRIAGRTALITGISSGIGEACARRFAEEGARVSGLDVQEPPVALGKDIAASGYELDFHRADIRDEDAVSHAIDAAALALGGIDCVVHAAGTSGAGVAHSLDTHEWDRVVDVNLKGSFLVAKHVLRHMVEQRAGSLVLISSVEGITGGNVVPHYNAAKGGVVLLMRNLAMDYGRYGIRVNCLCPGFIDTPMLAAFNENAPDDMRRRMEKAHMLERFGRPEEVAAAALFLCSEDASFVTGHALTVDGGFTAGHRLELAAPGGRDDSVP
ncbi:MAG: SDR family oxidoreductase [Deltaproteobacteria bacterium]|nr:SDR family oxidoreductase [Deltaproteobacteria bacterium]MBW2385203.1 SDR family oxidoreductase [Deltaproteobacteria bacterium]